MKGKKIKIFPIYHKLEEVYHEIENNDYDDVIFSILSEELFEWMYSYVLHKEFPHNFVISDFEINRENFDLKKLYELENLLKIKKTNLYVLIGTESNLIHKNYLNYPLDNFKLLFWPVFHLIHTAKLLSVKFCTEIIGEKNHSDMLEVSCKLLNKNILKRDLKYLYSNFNNTPRYHRCMMIDNLYNNNLFDKGKNTWNILTRDFMDRCQYDFKFWKETSIKSDDFIKNSTYCDELLIHESLFSLVGESAQCFNTTNLENGEMNGRHFSNFLTEKTSKEIILGKPFICYGGKNQNLKLKNYGFELYDEIIDYSFDCENNIEERIMGVIENLKKIENEDYNSLYLKIYDKVIYNKNRALEIITKDPYISKELLELLNLDSNYTTKDVYEKFYPLI